MSSGRSPPHRAVTSTTRPPNMQPERGAAGPRMPTVLSLPVAPEVPPLAGRADGSPQRGSVQRTPNRSAGATPVTRAPKTLRGCTPSGGPQPPPLGAPAQ